MDTVIGLQSGPVLVTIVDRRSRRSLLVKSRRQKRTRS
jgi:20S proteasome alpha/beta subunit